MKQLLLFFSLYYILFIYSLDLKNRSSRVIVPLLHWKNEAINHIELMDNLLYPPGDSMKERIHSINKNPIYNFLHTYYRGYSAQNLKKYSRGLGVLMECSAMEDRDYSCLNEKYLMITPEGCYYGLCKENLPDSTYGWITLSKNRNILHSTEMKQAFYGCFGLHEWAMLYSGRRDTTLVTKKRHQKIQLRVSQDVIDETVEQSYALKCTHYDAFRFFQAAAQPLNAVNMPTRDFQEENEQSGCVHTAMDLFKYAYQLYPFISSTLLRDCLMLAVRARKIDMRASPYDVSDVEGCSDPLCVETPSGRKAYASEQEALSVSARPLRLQLIHAYDLALESLAEPSLVL